jgi:hypothetical protein
MSTASHFRPTRISCGKSRPGRTGIGQVALTCNRVRAAAVHPGGIQTELSRHIHSDQIHKIVEQINTQLAKEGKEPFRFKTIPQGAATSVRAAVVASPEEIGGRYCENCYVGYVVAADATITAVSERVRSLCP